MDQSTDAAIDLIANGAPLSKLQKLFPSKSDAMLFYANAQAASYANLPSNCCNCGTGEPARIATFTWNATINKRYAMRGSDLLWLLIGHIHVSQTATQITFATKHPFCTSCWRRLFWKRRVADVLQFVGLLGGICLLFLAPVMVSVCVYFWSDHAWQKDRMSILIQAIGSTVLLFVCATLVLISDRLRVPVPLRNIARFPFRFVRLKTEATR